MCGPGVPRPDALAEVVTAGERGLALSLFPKINHRQAQYGVTLSRSVLVHPAAFAHFRYNFLHIFNHILQ
jgi:hypothetical protein